MFQGGRIMSQMLGHCNETVESLERKKMLMPYIQILQELLTNVTSVIVQKILKMEITGYLERWIYSFLPCRSQHDVNQSISIAPKVRSSVPPRICT